MNSKHKHKIVIIGGGYAGLIAALRLAGKAANNAEITLINARAGFVQRIRNHQVAAQQPVQQHSIPKLLGRRPVRFVQGRVTALDLARHTATVDNGEIFAYDKLLYALGSVAAKPDIPGVREHAYGIGNIEEAEALHTRMGSLSAGAEMVVIGGGLTGIETATELAESRPDLRVKLVTDGVVGPSLSERGRAYIRQVFADLNLGSLEHTRVQKIEAGQLFTNAGRRLPFDIAIWAGSFGVPSLAREAGLDVNASGRVRVDSQLRSISHPDVYAVGDSSIFADRTPLRMACATAFSTGAHAADNLLAWIAGKPQQPFSLHYGGTCISLGRKRGLLQFTNKDDISQERIITGFAAKVIKESICRGTIWGLKLERTWPGAVTWPGKDSPPAEQNPQQAMQIESV
ncbi:MAG: FAD-dependent oxidoreductase [Litorilinea sp.]